MKKSVLRLLFVVSLLAISLGGGVWGVSQLPSPIPEIGWRPMVTDTTKDGYRYIQFRDGEEIKVAQVRCQKPMVQDDQIYVLDYSGNWEPKIFVAAC